MTIVIKITGNGLVRFDQAAKALGEKRARIAYSRAVNRVGKTAGTATGRALAEQTGLPKSTGRKAVTRSVKTSKPDTLTYTINGQGGDVGLKYFKARETRKGVSAAPWNKRQVFGGTFMKAGFWPKRVVKPNWNGQVFRRQGGKFVKAKSGLFIPVELVQGEAAKAWQREGASRLQPRIEHEIKAMTKGVVS